MEDDGGEDQEFHSVIVPISLIHALTFEMLHVIDEWHEARGIIELDGNKCFVAMMASVEAAMETLHNESGKATIQ
jgi:hypothetical protein